MEDGKQTVWEALSRLCPLTADVWGRRDSKGNTNRWHVLLGTPSARARRARPMRCGTASMRLKVTRTDRWRAPHFNAARADDCRRAAARPRLRQLLSQAPHDRAQRLGARCIAARPRRRLRRRAPHQQAAGRAERGGDPARARQALQQRGDRVAQLRLARPGLPDGGAGCESGSLC